MNILKTGEMLSEAKRTIVIIETLFRYGLADLFDESSIAKRFSISTSNSDGRKTTSPQKVRAALEELGPAFVKLGQVMSTRPDILPFEYIVELEKLQDHVAPFPFHIAKSEIHASLGKSVDAVFASFEHEPVASASIAQVHVGTLHDGTKVAIKIKRPNIDRVINTDTKIILWLAQFLKNRHIVDEVWRPTEIAQEFQRSLLEELDFKNEMKNQKKFLEDFADDEHVKIPRIYDECSGENVITMEFIHGVELHKIANSRAETYPKKEIAAIGAAAILKQIFLHRFFHGDLHPGNLFWLPKSGQIAFIDFGLVGQLSGQEAEALIGMLYGIINSDAEKTLLGIEALGVSESSAQSEKLKEEVARLLSKYYNSTLSDIKMSSLIRDIFDMILKLRIHLPIAFVRLAKSLVTIETLAEGLDPDFNLFAVSAPYIKEAIRLQTSPKSVADKLQNTALQSARLFGELPNDAYWLLRNLKNNEFQVKIEHLKLDDVLDGITKMGNRLSVSLIIAGLIIGSSFVMPSFKQIGLFGYVIASVMGVWVIFSMIRKDRL